MENKDKGTSPFASTLVKVDNPVLVSSVDKKDSAGKKPKTLKKFTTEGKSLLADFCDESGQVKNETEEILDAILPPKEWEEDGKIWRQKVSSVPATRMDVINLQEQLDHQLKIGQARETGICPIRRELYSQCFDELIRQVTINCAERGLLLLRVRDEMRTTLEAYQSLYESCTAFGMRKALLAEASKTKLETEINELQIQKEELEKTIQQLEDEIQLMEKKFNEEMETAERNHVEEIQSLKKANHQLKQQLEGILNQKRAPRA